MRRCIAVLAACACLAMAAGFNVQGNMSEAWDKSTLRVRTAEEPAKLWFGLPAHSGITVVAKPDTGASITTVLNMSSTTDLPAPSTEYDITVRCDSGAGQWTCKDALGGPSLLGFGSSADEKRHAKVTYVADEDKETWTFTYPKEATFLVWLYNAAGKVVEEQDLYDTNELVLVGGGSFTFEVAPTDGSGEFTARK